MIEISVTKAGEHSLIRVLSPSGLSLLLSDYGAGLVGLYYKEIPMTIGDADLKDWEKTGSYFGKTVGRMAGRIKRGVLEFSGERYQIDVNEGKNTLHGGKLGYSFQLFHYEISHEEGYADIDFVYTSPDGEMGFPEEVTSRVRYRVYEEEPRFRIEFETRSKGTTPISLTNHSYFNLGAMPNVLGHTLTLTSGKVMHYDSELLPLGYEDAPEYLDFRKGRLLADSLDDPHLLPLKNKGIDHCFLLDEGKEEEPKITLESGSYRMDILTSFNAVVIYGDNYPVLGRPLYNGEKEALHSGLAIEPQLDPLDIEGMKVSSLHSQKNYIEYRFSEKEND